MNTTTRWPVILLALGGGILAASHFGKMPPSLPAIRDDLQLTLVQAGWAVSVFSLIGLIFGLFAGLLTDSFGARRILSLGLILLALGSIAGSFAETGSALLAARAIEGGGFLAAATSGGVLIAQATANEDLKLTLGLWSTYMPAGSALMILAAPVLLEALEWRGLFQLVAGISLLWAFLLLRIEAPAPAARTTRQSLGRTVRTVLTSAGPVALSLCFSFYTFQWITLMVWLPSAMIETMGLSTTAAATVTAIVVATNIVGNLGAGWLQSRGLKRWTVLAGGAVLMLVSAQIIFIDTLPDYLRLIGCLVFSGAGGMLPGAILSGAPVVSPTPNLIGATNGLMVQGSHLGQMIGPPVIAAIVSANGHWEASVWAMNAAALLTILLVFLTRRQIG